MKVLIISQYFWPESFRINDLALGLQERGHTVSVLTGMPNYPGGRFYAGYRLFSPLREDFHGIEVLRVPLLPRGGGRGWRLVLNYLSFALLACMTGPFRAGRGQDLVFVFEPSPITVGLPALVIKRVHKVPIMFWVQDLWPESLSATGVVRSAWLLRRVEWLVRLIYKGCDRILVQSEGFVERVAKVGADPARVDYFPNWAEALYQPAAKDPGFSGGEEMPDGFCVMFAGNIGSAQSFETILEAFEMLADAPDVHCVVLGDGHRRKWLQEEIESRGLGGRVHVLGSRPVETMPAYFALADALLVSLRKDPVFALTVPSKIQSYLACGRPVVASLDGEGADIIRRSGGGLSAAAGDAAALAQAVRSLHAMSAEERQAMGARGRAYYEQNFEREMLLERLEGWMEQVAGEQACAS